MHTSAETVRAVNKLTLGGVSPWFGVPALCCTGKLALKNGASKYRFYIETFTVLVRLGTSRSRSPLVLFYIFDHNSKSLHRTPLI